MSIIKKTLPDGQKPHTTVTGPGLTKQEFGADSDINNIMKRVVRTGIMPVLQNAQPVFADVSTMPDFAEALRRTTAATQAFQQLPAHIRHEFHNDARQLVAFLADEKNRNRAEELGLVAPKPVVPDPAPGKTPPPVA